jgi:uncharacterized protein (TIGR02145 family)
LDGFVDDPDCADWASECVDVAACNYAEWGACNYECEGCRIPTACNYNGSVLFGNIELCLFPNGYCQECGGNPANGQGFVTIQDSDNDGICDLDDPCVGGCLQGCESSVLQIEISVEGVEVTCQSDLSYQEQIAFGVQVCPDTLIDTLGVYVLDEFTEGNQIFVEFVVAAFSSELGSLTSYQSVIPINGFLGNGECQILGCTSAEACNFNPEANLDDGSCQYPSCVCDCADNCISGDGPIVFYAYIDCYWWPPTEFYLPDEDLACLFSNGLENQEGESCLVFLNGDLVFEGIPGFYYDVFGTLTEPMISPQNFPCSTDTIVFKFPLASNDTITLTGFWSPETSGCGDLSSFYGCTDMQAVNFQYEFLCDDGSCIYTGCTDPLSCNFDSEANSDDGSCDYSCCPGPGCCSQGLFWDWELEQCFPTNPADINLDGCVQLNDLLDLLGAYGDCGAEESPWQCGDPLEYQGYDYETVQIGEQCWFAENLRAENYRNGEAVSSQEDWGVTTMGAQVVYDFEVENLTHFGRLYNWYAVEDNRSLCPEMWKVPSDEDWDVLVQSIVEEGGVNASLKADSLWCCEGNGNDAFGFDALPAGAFNSASVFNGLYNWAYWWTSSIADPPTAWRRSLHHSVDEVGRYNSNKHNGFSIRCIKDTE